jgi:hypothetical protein
VPLTFFARYAFAKASASEAEAVESDEAELISLYYQSFLPVDGLYR